MNIETKKLEELCTIKTGAPASRAKNIPEGAEPVEVKMLTPRAMQDGKINDDELTTEFVGEVKQENLTRESDVVIKLSTPFDSMRVDKNHEGILVTSFAMVLRKKPEVDLDMQYLSMYLNMAQTKAVLQAKSAGVSTALSMLKRKDVADLEVPLLPLEHQQTLAELFEVTQQQNAQYEKLIALGNELISSKMTRSIWGKEA